MLITQVRHEGEESGKFGEIIFSEDEEQLYRHRFVAEKIAEKLEERVLRLRRLGKFFSVFGRFFEERHEFFELVEDE